VCQVRIGRRAIVQYPARIVAGKNTEDSHKVTYAKINPDKKAKTVGIMLASTASEQPLAQKIWK
jgi:hypothetical protein